jgi:hypothetical protein
VHVHLAPVMHVDPDASAQRRHAANRFCSKEDVGSRPARARGDAHRT